MDEQRTNYEELSKVEEPKETRTQKTIKWFRKVGGGLKTYGPYVLCYDWTTRWRGRCSHTQERFRLNQHKQPKE